MTRQGLQTDGIVQQTSNALKQADLLSGNAALEKELQENQESLKRSQRQIDSLDEEIASLEQNMQAMLAKMADIRKR